MDIKEIFGSMQKAGLQPPTVAEPGDCVMLTFRLVHSSSTVVDIK